MLGFQIAVQWLHVLGGIFWFGGVLFTGVILGPAMTSLPPQTAATVFESTARRLAVTSEIVGGFTIVLGVIRGTVFGPVRSIDFLFGTAFGITWTIALVLALGVLAIGHFVINPAEDRVKAAIAAGDTAAMRRELRPVLINVAAFFGIFTCMILMRFGL